MIKCVDCQGGSLCFVIYIIYIISLIFTEIMADDKEENMKKAPPNEWAFVRDHIQGDDDNGDGRFTRETMLCFKKHGVLALTFHASFDSGIVCSKCFQFMKPGSFALHCEKCDKQETPSKKEIKQWKDSDKKWANLKRCDGDIFQNKTTVWIVVRDGVSAYVVHPRFYLGKTSSTLKLKAMCITDGCTKVCTLNGLYKHFKESHMPGTHTIHPLRVIKAPTKNDAEVCDDNDDDDIEDINDSVKTGVTDMEGTAGDKHSSVDVVDVVEMSDVLENGEAKGTEDNEFAEIEGEGGCQKSVNNTTDANQGTKFDEIVAENNGGEGDDMELDCEPYVNEGGPTDDDTEAEDAKVRASVAGRKKKSTLPSHGVRKSTRPRRTVAHY